MRPGIKIEKEALGKEKEKEKDKATLEKVSCTVLKEFQTGSASRHWQRCVAGNVQDPLDTETS